MSKLQPVTNVTKIRETLRKTEEVREEERWNALSDGEQDREVRTIMLAAKIQGPSGLAKLRERVLAATSGDVARKGLLTALERLAPRLRAVDGKAFARLEGPLSALDRQDVQRLQAAGILAEAT